MANASILWVDLRLSRPSRGDLWLEPHYRVAGLDNRLSPWVTIALHNCR